jgi:hypothetical protein
VLAILNRLVSNRSVGGRNRQIEYQLNLGVREKIVGGQRASDPSLGRHRLGPCRIQIGDRDDLNAVKLFQVFEVDAANVANADNTDSYRFHAWARVPPGHLI